MTLADPRTVVSMLRHSLTRLTDCPIFEVARSSFKFGRVEFSKKNCPTFPLAIGKSMLDEDSTLQSDARKCRGLVVGGIIRQFLARAHLELLSAMKL